MAFFRWDSTPRRLTRRRPIPRDGGGRECAAPGTGEFFQNAQGYTTALPGNAAWVAKRATQRIASKIAVPFRAKVLSALCGQQDHSQGGPCQTTPKNGREFVSKPQRSKTRRTLCI